MKRKICLLLAMLVMITSVGCGSEKEPDNKDSEIATDNGSVDSEDMTSETEEESETESEIKKDVKTVRVPAGYLYVDCDTSLKVKKDGYTALMYDTNDALVGFSSKQSIKHEGTLVEAIDYFKSDFIYDASLSSTGDLVGEAFEVLTTEEVTMAGRDSIRFTGKVLNRDTWECHVYGYVFVIDGIPCAVIGLVSAQEQDAGMIAEIDTRVDEIASTLRTTE